MSVHKKYFFFSILFLSSLSSCTQNKYAVNSNTEFVNSTDDKTQVGIKTKQFNFPSDTYVLVGAHRAGGFKHGFPENSFSAIKNSLELGVDIIEIDLRMTLDRKLVVIHDKTLDRTTNGSGKVSHHKLKKIKKLYLKDKDLKFCLVLDLTLTLCSYLLKY